MAVEDGGTSDSGTSRFTKIHREPTWQWRMAVQVIAVHPDSHTAKNGAGEWRYEWQRYMAVDDRGGRMLSKGQERSEWVKRRVEDVNWRKQKEREG
jgi:hypothetical protein